MVQGRFQKILNWPSLGNPKSLKSFLEFANFYRCFIKNYSKTIGSLTKFVKEDSILTINEQDLSQFNQLRESLKTSAILSQFNPPLPTIVETNYADYSMVSVLFQVSDSGKHPIELDSHRCIQ
ncbi:hypothetical protein O181_006480 [Austropuccinia psidii MF-1]|uniref:Reverse transcriptase/retrotransposon-derived protein RNase H-like domain-containing protein n=1 Tax=Austropuccinia psidii MF-1 TaxID=1389203 RepID=A0A9Q3GGW6_9BASI|nr:hypothetical protein [Austropuccinia psidii MF-1]